MIDIIETWKEIPNTNGYIYASKCGKIKSCDRKGVRNGKTFNIKEMIHKKSIRNGYERVAITVDGFHVSKSVHRLVAMAHIPNPNNLPLVCHKNDIKTDNRAENLFWGTVQDNAIDCVNKGRNNVDGRKLNSEQVRKIRSLIWDSNLTQKEIAKEFNVSRQCICNIKLSVSYQTLGL